MANENSSISAATAQLLPIGIIVVGAVALFFIVKSQLGKLAQTVGLADSDELIAAAKEEIAAIKYDEKLLTHSNDEFKSYVSRLMRAMEGAGTDESEVFDVLAKMNNKEDWKKLQKMFGTPSNMTLRAWLNSELAQINLDDVVIKSVAPWMTKKMSERDKVDAIIKRLELPRYKVTTKSTIAGLPTVTGWFPVNKVLTPLVNLPNNTEIGTLVSIVKRYNEKAKVSQDFAVVRTNTPIKNHSYYLVLRSQVQLKEF